MTVRRLAVLFCLPCVGPAEPFPSITGLSQDKTAVAQLTDNLDVSGLAIGMTSGARDRAGCV